MLHLEHLCLVVQLSHYYDIVAHFDLKLHHMDLRIAFLNRDLVEDVYISYSIGFEEVGKEHLVCKIQKIHLWSKLGFQAVVSQI